MIGNLLAGTDEAPGRVVTRRGKKYKAFRGMASGAARRLRGTDPEEDPLRPTASEEGVSGYVPYRGSAAAVVQTLAAGLRSGISYGGARSIEELRENAEFIAISSAGLAESGPHDVMLG